MKLMSSHLFLRPEHAIQYPKRARFVQISTELANTVDVGKYDTFCLFIFNQVLSKRRSNDVRIAYVLNFFVEQSTICIFCFDFLSYSLIGFGFDFLVSLMRLLPAPCTDVKRLTGHFFVECSCTPRT